MYEASRIRELRMAEGPGLVAVKPRLGLLIHGRHLFTEQWEDIVWGRPPHELGQLPMGVRVALDQEAALIALGTGASSKGGKPEAAFTRDYLFENLRRIRDFDYFAEIDVAMLE